MTPPPLISTGTVTSGGALPVVFLKCSCLNIWWMSSGKTWSAISTATLTPLPSVASL